MHPLMPFITEELWQRIPRPPSRKASIAFGPYPTNEDERPSRAPEVEGWMEILQSAISAARTVRSEHDIRTEVQVPIRVRSDNPELVGFLRGHVEAIRFLVRTRGDPVFEAAGGAREPGTTVSVVPSTRGSIEVLVGLKGLVDPKTEEARIERERKKIDRELAAIDKKLAAPGFVARAPKEVVNEAKAQRAALDEARGRLDAAQKLTKEL